MSGAPREWDVAGLTATSESILWQDERTGDQCPFEASRGCSSTGSWSMPGSTFDNVNPATEEVLGTVADASAAEMQRAIDAARRAFDNTD
jgi:Aldehyde dehydrogenase family